MAPLTVVPSTFRLSPPPSVYYSSRPFYEFPCICSTFNYPDRPSKRRGPVVVAASHYLLSPAAASAAVSRICRATETDAEYKFPDPIPEFAEAETEKFRAHLLKRLPTKEVVYGDSLGEVVQICTEIFSTFLHSEYGGPGTLMVEPFIDMCDTVEDRGLPGGTQAARVAVTWAQKHVDADWNEWTGEECD